MNNQEGIWVNKTVSSPKGDVIVSIRLDTSIDPEVICTRLEKEGDALNKDMDRIVAKMDKFNNKTPQKIIDATIQELREKTILKSNNITEYFRWSEALRLRIVKTSY